MIIRRLQLAQMRPKTLDKRAFTKQGRLWLYILAFGIVGMIIVLVTRAAPNGIASEPENGTLVGGAQPLTNATASGGRAVIFGGTQDPAMLPTNLRGFTGGDSIAVRWAAVGSQYGLAKYHVYRNDVKVAVIDAATTPARRYEQQGTSYIDKAVTPGASYTYKIMAESNGRFSPLTAGLSVTHPTSTTAVPTVNITLNGVTGLDTYVANATDTIKTWYPKAVDTLARGGYVVPTTITIAIDPTNSPNCAGFVYFGTSTVNVCESYARRNQDDMSLFSHEMTHIIQAYTVNITQLGVEGLASWVGDNSTGYIQPMPSQNEDYDTGYAAGSYFISWVMQTYNLPNLPRVMNVSAHNTGRQPAATLQELTGKTASQLWLQMTGRIVTPPGPLKGVNGRCADLQNAVLTAGATIDLLNCYTSPYQEARFIASAADPSAGLLRFPVAKLCMVPAGGSTADLTRVVLGTCDFANNLSLWQHTADGGLKNVASGRCLRPLGGSNTNGIALEITNCASTATSPNQKWTLPPY